MITHRVHDGTMSQNSDSGNPTSTNSSRKCW